MCDLKRIYSVLSQLHQLTHQSKETLSVEFVRRLPLPVESQNHIGSDHVLRKLKIWSSNSSSTHKICLLLGEKEGDALCIEIFHFPNDISKFCFHPSFFKITIFKLKRFQISLIASTDRLRNRSAGADLVISTNWLIRRPVWWVFARKTFHYGTIIIVKFEFNFYVKRKTKDLSIVGLARRPKSAWFNLASLYWIFHRLKNSRNLSRWLTQEIRCVTKWTFDFFDEFHFDRIY